MQAANCFFVIFFLTIVIARILIYLKPIQAPTIKGFRTHHYMFGVILIPIALLFKNLELFAVGLGLFVDELTYLIIRGKNHRDNYSKISIFGTVIFIIIIFLTRNFLISFL